MGDLQNSRHFCLALTTQKLITPYRWWREMARPSSSCWQFKTHELTHEFCGVFFSPPFGAAWSSEDFWSVNRSDSCNHQALEVGGWGCWIFSKVSSSFVGSVYQLGPWSEWEDPVWGRFGRGWTPIELNLEHITVQDILSSVKELIFDSSSVYKLRLWYIMIHIIRRIIGYTGAMSIRDYMRVIPIIPVVLPSTGP